MKKTIIIAIAILLGSVLVGSVAAFGVAGAKDTGKETNTLFVTGIGTIKAKPDKYRVELTVTTIEKLARDAQQNNDKKANAVIEAIKKMGIKEEQIITTGYWLNPVYKWNPETNENMLNGYQASYSLNVTTTDLKKISEVIDTATSNGVNQIGGITFDIANKEEFQNEALKLAMRDAKKKAEIALGEYGKTIFTINTITLNSSQMPMPYMNQMQANKSYDNAQGGVAPDIMSGPLEFTVTVNVEFGY